MQSRAALVLLALSCAGLCRAVDSGSPIEKVVHLLTDLQAKIKSDGANEKALYEKYSCWCTSMTSKKGKAIEEAKDELKKLGNKIQSLRSKVAKLSSEINDAAKDMVDNHADQQKATLAREKENAAFTATRAEMGQALQSLGQALKMLKMAPQFLQTTQALSTEAADTIRSAIDAIPEKALGALAAPKLAQLQTIGSALADGKYSPAYGSLVNILEEMYKTFSSDLEKETSNEGKTNKNYEDLMNTKVKELKALQDKVDKKEEQKAEAASDLADTTQNYDDTEDQMEADIKFFTEAVDSCEKKNAAWTERTKMREEELEGVEKAIEILSSDDARDLFAKSIDAGKRASFLQIDATPSMVAGQQQAFKALKSLATNSQNVALAMIAAKVRMAKGGHFGEVMKAIDKVVGVLKKEQDDDNKKKTQCNEEYHKIAKTSAKIDWKIEKNEAKIDNLETTIENKEKEKAATIESIADTKQEIKDMKKERKEQKETYDEEKKDDENAIKLLNQAKEALLAFHKKHKLNAALTEFIQGEADPDKMDRVLRGEAAPDAKFSGKGSRSQQTKGINMLLQNIVEGLEDEIRVQTKNEKDSIAAFKKALKSAEDLQKTLETKKTNLEKEIADRNKDKDDENKKMKANQADLKDEQDYHAKIKPDCDFLVKNWQSRFNKRKAEMDGLVTAKDFLAGAMKNDGALLQTKRLRAPVSKH